MIWAPWLEALKGWEGFKPKVYRCPAGVWTQGYGHTGPDVTASNPPVTREQAEAWLREDMQEAVALAGQLSPSLAPATVARQSAVYDFVFNCGPVNYRDSTFRKRVDAGLWELAAKENARWKRGGGKVLPGLVKRRAVTSKWLMEG